MSTAKSQTHLAGLPPELLTQVLTHPCLSVRDLKAVRATCWLLEPVASEILFRRAILSKTWHDRNVFLNVASVPRLAQWVKELVFYELCYDATAFDTKMLISIRRSTRSMDGYSGDDVDTMLPQLAKQAEEMFWIPTIRRPPIPEGQTSITVKGLYRGLEDAIREFESLLDDAVNAMPNLDTFVSRPMPPHRLLNPGHATDEYPMTAQLFRRSMDRDYNRTNQGVYRVLLSCMARKDVAIKRLYWADEDLEPSLARAGAGLPAAFNSLEVLDLCINNAPGWQLRTGNVDRIVRGLRGAQNLRELTLCFESSSTLSMLDDDLAGDDSIPPHAPLLGPLLVSHGHRWEKLQTLTLVDCEDHLLNNQSQLAEFLVRHAPSLRHLRLYECHILDAVWHRLAHAREVRLNSITVLPRDNIVRLVPESTLLDYVNGVTKEPPFPNDTRPISTATSGTIWDHRHGWRTAAYFDASSRVYQHKYDADARDSLFAEAKPAKSLWPRLWPDEVAPEHIDLESFEDDADFHRDGMREYTSPTAFEMDDDTDDEDYRPGDTDGQEDTDMTDAPGAASTDIDGEDSRVHAAPRWEYRHYYDDFCWPVERGGHATEIWHFTRANGDYAFGTDPLEYFSDWDSEAGDEADATPYGRRLTGFVVNRDRNLTPPTTDPPAGATAYNFGIDMERLGLERPSEICSGMDYEA